MHRGKLGPKWCCRPGQVPETTPSVKAKGVESLSTARANAQPLACKQEVSEILRTELSVNEHGPFLGFYLRTVRQNSVGGRGTT